MMLRVPALHRVLHTLEVCPHSRMELHVSLTAAVPNGRYVEHGIKAVHGFARERWRIAPEFTVPLDPHLARVGVLLEPTSVVAKAWEHIERIGQRAEPDAE